LTLKKKWIPSLFFLFLMTASISPAHADATSVLRLGANSANVTTLQQNLKTLGYFKYPYVTGYYGPVTRQAVRSFQSDYGLQTDGIVGPVTHTAIQHALVKRKMMQDAKQYVGVPYVWGGSTPSGFDCSGFIYYLFSTHGASVPRLSSTAYAKIGWPVDSSHLKPGDLVFFGPNGTIDHVGFYLGNRRFISATSSKGVWIYSLDNPYWASQYEGARRVY
jgi:cell wall-associated NlpC family hydrolase